MSCALVLDPDGDIRVIDLSDGDTQQAMRAAIGCRAVDVVPLTTQLAMWLDGEGPVTQPRNPVATALACCYGRASQPCHGPAVLAGVGGDGGTVNLTSDQALAVLCHLNDALDGA